MIYYYYHHKRDEKTDILHLFFTHHTHQEHTKWTNGHGMWTNTALTTGNDRPSWLQWPNMQMTEKHLN